MRRSISAGARMILAFLTCVSAVAVLAAPPAQAAANPSLRIGDVTLGEGQAGLQTAAIVIGLSEPLASDLTVLYTTADDTATAPSDYTPKVNKKLKIKAGKTSAVVGVKIVGDTVDEDDEQMTVTITGTTGTTVDVARAIGTVTVLDDDPGTGTPTLSMGDTAIAEGGSGLMTAKVNLTLSAPLAADLTVNFYTASNTANRNEDYVPRDNKKLKIKAGKTSVAIPIKIVGDIVNEGDEVFNLNVLTTTGPTVDVVRPFGEITILDDEAPAPPGAPSDVVVAATAFFGEYDLTWNAPADDGGFPIVEYGIERSTDGGATWDLHTTSSTTSVVVFCEGAAVTCTYRVAASNGVSEGPFSEASNGVTTPDVPGAPTGLSAANSSTPGAVDLSWTAPASDGGDPITSHVIELSEDGGTTWILHSTINGQTSATLTDLTPLVPYVLRVAAGNGSGTGPFSDPSGSVTPTTIPGAPDAPGNVIVAKDNQAGRVNVSWTAPPTEPDYYKIEASDDGGSSWYMFGNAVDGSETSTVRCCFSVGTHKTRVIAVNNNGSSPAGPANDFTFTVNPPTGVDTAASSFPGEVIVTWTAATGTWPADRYRVETSVDGGTTWIEHGDHFAGTSAPISSCFETCLFRVVAIVDIFLHINEEGPPSASSSFTPTLDAPTDVAANAGPVAGEVSVTWTASVGTWPADAYTIERSSDGGGSWTEVAANVSTTSAVINSQSGSSLLYRVTGQVGTLVSPPSDPSNPVTP